MVGHDNTSGRTRAVRNDIHRLLLAHFPLSDFYAVAKHLREQTALFVFPGFCMILGLFLFGTLTALDRGVIFCRVYRACGHPGACKRNDEDPRHNTNRVFIFKMLF